MAIHVPGKRDRHGKISGAKRSVVAVLSLTAMVDLFTVLVVFLLQNYATTGEVIDIPEGVHLPQAKEVKELKPANVVIVSEKGIQVNNEIVMAFNVVKGQEDWMLEPLRTKVAALVEEGEREKAAIPNRLRQAVEKIKVGDEAPVDEVDMFRKMTIQADQKIDFLTLKKVMFTVTEAGIHEINFAVLKRVDSTAAITK